MMDFIKYKFDEIIEDCTKYGVKIPTNDYLEKGRFPIIDQGQNFIAGYSNSDNGIYSDVPAIIFGDHTRVFKYIDFPFFLGADGVKILKAKKEISYKYLFYYFLQAKFPNTGYARHYKWLKELEIPVPPIEKQKSIVKNLDKVTKIIKVHKNLLEKYDILIKSRFIEMFGDIRNQEKYKGIPLSNLCKTMTGGTPPTSKPEYYEGTIPWITTVSLGPNHIDGKNAKGYITEEAIKNSATKLIPVGNILFGTRVGVGKSSINDVDICTNQDIIALIGIDESRYSKLFIKHVLDQYHPYFDSIKKGATILGITTDDVKKSLIPDVSLSLQKEFENFVQQIDKSKVAVQKSLEKVETLYKSLMQEYFGE